MDSFTLQNLHAREILDSRGRPTVWSSCRLSNGAVGAASVPSGASKGTAEAFELRDGDSHRYGGWGCRLAVANVRTKIGPHLAGREFASQATLDEALLQLDGTPNKSNLGANALLAVSLATARAVAASRGVPLYRHFADVAGESLRGLPRPTVNLFSGGKHAGGQSPLQDVLVVPVAAATIDEALATVFAVYQAAAGLAGRKYGMRLLRADEGGLAPPFPNAQAMLDDAVEAIVSAGYQPGREVALAVDAAATHFFHDGIYALGPEQLDAGGMIARWEEWMRRYPIVSLEDGLAENDWENWPRLRAKLGGRCLILGDDFLCTQVSRIERAAAARAADALLLKVNQVGTLSEALTALKAARAAGWQVTVSARSGETEDDWLADLATGWAGDQIKIGSLTQSDRLAKYNRLLAIEEETQLPVAPWRRSPG